MTTKRIIYSRPDGGVTVVCPAPAYIAQLIEQSILALDEISEDEAIAVVQAKDVPPDATNVEIMELASLPGREFRGAWEKPGTGVPIISMVKAREIHAEHIVIAQSSEIARLKIEERKERVKGKIAQSNSHVATVVELEALDLNVLATQIAAALNPTALSAIWPANVPR